MKTVKEAYPTFRSAVEGMIEGLKNHDQLGVCIDMSTFGRVEQDVCFGCAATCTALNAEPSLPVSESSRRAELRKQGGSLNREWSDFEDCIDDFRFGEPLSLLELYHLESSLPCTTTDWHLDNRHWEKQLPKIKQWLDDNEF